MVGEMTFFPPSASPQKPTTAWGYVTAHMSRIHDIDWSYLDRHQLTTCSHDSSIKFWDTSSPRDPISTMKTGSQPVWRARNYVSHTLHWVYIHVHLQFVPICTCTCTATINVRVHVCCV